MSPAHQIVDFVWSVVLVNESLLNSCLARTTLCQVRPAIPTIRIITASYSSRPLTIPSYLLPLAPTPQALAHSSLIAWASKADGAPLEASKASPLNGINGAHATANGARSIPQGRYASPARAGHKAVGQDASVIFQPSHRSMQTSKPSIKPCPIQYSRYLRPTIFFIHTTVT